MVFGAAAGAVVGTMIAANTGGKTVRGAGLTAPGGAHAFAGQPVHIIAKRQATERQRHIADQRARAYYGRMVTKQQRDEQAARKSGEHVAPRTTPRYIAVDTEKNEQTPPRAKGTVMLWDTKSKAVVGASAYDVQTSPKIGSTTRIETYSAEYVGSGN